MEFNSNRQHLKTIKLSKQPSSLKNETDDSYFKQNSKLPEYRQKLQDKVHPNAVLINNNKMWISRFLNQTIETGDKESTIHLPGCPHDLVPEDNHIWCTTTDGKIWRFNNEQKEPRLMFDTYRNTSYSGWCRGLYIDKEIVLAGLTRISRIPRVRWTDRPFEQTVTGIMALNRNTGDLIDFLNLDKISTHPKIFSVINLNRSETGRSHIHE
jgi:hypothetical protein